MPPRYTSREFLDRLVAFPTISADSNLDLIRFVGDYLSAWGVAWRLSHDDSRRKANLFATLPARSGEAKLGGLVLSDHTDVVPVAGQDWHSDPFTVVERGGLLYGRGTSDMKAFAACVLALLPEFIEAPPSIPLHLALSYDEEVGCFGAVRLIDDLLAAGYHPRLAVIGEPTLMQVVNGHKGVFGFRTTVTGVPAHSSQPHRGANAIFAAARIIEAIRAEAEAAKTRARPDTDFQPPYTSVNCNQIEGGTAVNILPEKCSFYWEFRLAPWDEAAAITGRITHFIDEVARPALKAEHPDADIVTEQVVHVPPLRPEPGNEMEAIALSLTGLNRATTVSYGTEAGLFQQAGMATVICGPGSIDQAHQPNEFIDPAQLTACEAFLRKLVARFQ